MIPGRFQPITPWVFMWGLSFAIYFSLKLVSLNFARGTGHAPLWKRAAYLLAWPGMDAETFLADSDRFLQPPNPAEWLFASFKFLMGMGLLWIVVPALASQNLWLVGWAGLLGIAFTVHFGLFHLLSCAWRHCGIAAVPIMNWPIASQSLTEFWGRRWNLAFRDLTHRFLFLPLIQRMGPVGALFTGFFVSGLVHDLVISWPANGGYGRPTLFFLLQGIAILVERSRSGRQLGLGHGLAGRCFCLLAILLPSPLLFHASFLSRVILPFLTAIGAGEFAHQ
ncbi:MAG: hypothetical protein JSS49_05820 [Planctomycetes bacterium]|nr:hypothetical protein [Planctomycetota bacterium]